MNQMTLYVTSLCNRACHECIMANLMTLTRGYHMSLEELQQFLQTSEQSGYRFQFQLSGGEPLLWRHLVEGLTMLRVSKVTRSILLFTNGVSLKKVDDTVIDLLDEMRISEYGPNLEQAKVLKKKYPRKVRVVNRRVFWKNPVEPVDGSLPAECLNAEAMYMDYKVYACPHSASINGGRDCTPKGVDLFVPLELGYLAKLKGIREAQEEEVCSRCISNAKIRRICGRVSADRKIF